MQRLCGCGGQKGLKLVNISLIGSSRVIRVHRRLHSIAVAKGEARERLSRARGTHDYFADQVAKQTFVERTLGSVAERYGFGEVRTPVIEPVGVFSRTLGEHSDVVSKEMFHLRSGKDRGDDETLVLRPEQTAGVCACILESRL